MNGIVLAVLLVTGIGLIAAAGLVLAGRFMSVPADEKAHEIEKLLPGANCGGCGFSGCSGYADAICNSGAKTNLCTVGGSEVAKKVAESMGTQAEETEKRVACVYCGGENGCAVKKADYRGFASCKSVSALFGGTLECRFGCIGLGDCVKKCDYCAIGLKNGIASVEPTKCVACGKCVSACPKKIIKLIPVKNAPQALCSNTLSGAVTRKACTAGCIGCKMCERACENGAVKVTDNLAVIDPSKCVGCMKCVAACKPGCIKLLFAAEDCAKR